MNRLVLTPVILVIITHSRFAVADGGAVLTTRLQDDYRITVLTSPTPLRAGQVDVSVLVQHADTGMVVATADVEVSLRSNDKGQRPLQAPATRGNATNKLFRAALFTLPQPGRWRLSTVVTIGNGQLVSEADIEAFAALPQFSDLWLWAGWPALAIGLFAAHRRLVHRAEPRQKAGRGGGRK
jgi:hypothetical protein